MLEILNNQVMKSLGLEKIY